MKKISFQQILTILATILVITVNALANILPINGQGTGEISDRFDIFFVPAGYVFSIWGLIYIGILGYSIFQALPAQRDNPLLQKLSPMYWWSCAANIVWIFLWHYEMFGLTLIVMLALLGTLLTMYGAISSAKANFTSAEKWAIQYPFSLYLGWISVATIANASQVLYFYNWGGWGISAPVWAVIMIVVATGLGVGMALREGDWVYNLVLAWAFAGIANAQASTALVANAAWAGAVVGALAAAWVGIRK